MTRCNIFISVAAYLEDELEQTIRSAIDNAYDPKSLHFGVFQQSSQLTVLESSTSKITNKWIHFAEALGAGFARSEVQKMYDNEKYFLQIDAHSVFTKHWDKRLINWLKKLPPKSVISGWPMPYTRKGDDIWLNVHEQGNWPCQEPHYTEAVKYGRTWVGARRPLEGAEYQWSQVGLGGQWFCEGSFVNEVPYDPRISWHGEEFLLSVRAFDAGWEIYGVNDTILYHNYARHGTPRVWDGDKEWKRKQAESVGIQSDLLCFKDQSIYQMKNPDRLKEYQDRANIKDLQETARNTAIRLGVRNKNSCMKLV